MNNHMILGETASTLCKKGECARVGGHSSSKSIIFSSILGIEMLVGPNEVSVIYVHAMFWIVILFAKFTFNYYAKVPN